MSGGVGPTYKDTALAKQEEHHATAVRPFSFQQLIILAVVLVLSASGLVTLEDFLFTLLTLIYFFFLSKRILPPHKNPKRDAPLTSPANKIFRLYVASAGVAGLLIPLLYIFQGFVADDRRGVSAAAPHVFLLASQVLMEGIAAACGFSAPARILVPVVYNARRVMTLVEWITNEFSRETTTEYGGKGTVSVRRMYTGRVLAAVNLGIWSFNLFGVLLPVYLPRAFKRYYGSSKEVSFRFRSILAFVASFSV
ncbi:Transmembrane protein [Hirschfeldia incana]|nr:Transmembrane protein [Hirschfeldia incana]